MAVGLAAGDLPEHHQIHRCDGQPQRRERHAVTQHRERVEPDQQQPEQRGRELAGEKLREPVVDRHAARTTLEPQGEMIADLP